MTRWFLALLSLCGGCYRLDALVSPAGQSIELVGSPLAKHVLAGGSTTMDLPLGLEPGDVVVAFLASDSDAAGTPADGWVSDDAAQTECTVRFVQEHLVVGEAGVGSTFDVSGAVSGFEWLALVVAFRGVAALGGGQDHIYSSQSLVPPPLTIALPPANAGELALVMLLADASANPQAPANGRPLVSSNGMWLFSVPIADPAPAQLALDSELTSCVSLRAQLLLP